jgi:hypothetical protein
MIGNQVAEALELDDFALLETALRCMTTRYGCGVSEGDLPIKALQTAWPFRNTTEVFFALVRALSDGSPIVGEKTPRHLEHADQVLHECPSAKVVVCLRDPRAVYASMVKVPWGSSDLVVFTEEWAAYADEARRLVQHFPERVQCLHYEDVVADQGFALYPIWEMLGLSAPNTVPDGAKTFSLDDEPWKVGADGPIHSDSLHRWENELDPALVRELMDRVGASAAPFGY